MSILALAKDERSFYVNQHVGLAADERNSYPKILCCV
jgi:hypothetical protein